MRNAYYARDNFDVRRGGRGFSCAVKNTLISQKDAVDTRTFRVKPNTPKLLSMPGKKWWPTLGSPLYIYGSHTFLMMGLKKSLHYYSKSLDITINFQLLFFHELSTPI